MIQTIESREVASMVEKEHKELLRDIRKYVSVLTSANLRSLDYFIPSEYKDGKGEIRPCYNLTKLGCELVGNKITREKGIIFTATYVSRFNSMEKQLSDPMNELAVPGTFAEALRLAADLEEEKQALQRKITTDQPFTNFGKVIAHSNGSIPIGEFCKNIYEKHGIAMGRNKMFNWLREKGYLISRGRERNNPKQIYIEQGLFVSRVTLVTRTSGQTQESTTLITGKGQVKILEQLQSELLMLA